MISEAISLLDVLGVVAFAFVGVEKARRKNLDVFGAILLGVLTPIGGGVLRDVVNNSYPFAFANQWYLGLAVISAFAFAMILKNGATIPKNLVLAGDTLGLAAFAVVGASVAVSSDRGVLAAMAFAVLTGAFGGLISDVLVNNVSFILNREIYASAAALGGLAFFMSVPLGADAAGFAGFATTAGLRVASVKFGINLPKMKAKATR